MTTFKDSYFCIDDEKIPYKGVRGKASARIIEEISIILPIAEKIMIKYNLTCTTVISPYCVEAIKFFSAGGTKNEYFE